jgi:hypothetical protein
MPFTVIGAVPVLETVAVCGALVVPLLTVPNGIVGGDTELIGATPVPDRDTFSVG